MLNGTTQYLTAVCLQSVLHVYPCNMYSVSIVHVGYYMNHSDSVCACIRTVHVSSVQCPRGEYP